MFRQQIFLNFDLILQFTLKFRFSEIYSYDKNKCDRDHTWRFCC